MRSFGPAVFSIVPAVEYRQAQKKREFFSRISQGDGDMARILIADIDKNLGFLLGQELEDEGYTVDVVLQGDPALPGLVRDPEYHVILLDMPMPCLDYYNRIERIKKNNPAAYVVILYSSAASEETANLLDAGADACVARDEIDKLKTYLRHCIRPV
jgi:CheY-like chemotaxis protein